MNEPTPQDTEREESALERLLASTELPDSLRDELMAVAEETRALEDRMLRSIAETENQRRRLSKEQADRVRFANERLLGEMLVVLDSLTLCVAHADDSADPSVLREGVLLTVSQFEGALENAGAKPIRAAVGDPFDPKVHEAALQDDESPLPARTITRVLQPGFTYHEHVLRPVRVVVSSGKGSGA
ncbi:MAG: nucleotide exchange factor GrpE [Polyangiales bacterium]